LVKTEIIAIERGECTKDAYNAIRKLSKLLIVHGYITHKLIWTLIMRKLELMHTKSATYLIVLSRLVVAVTKFRQLSIFLKSLSIFEKLDAPSHKLMDLESRSNKKKK
jgi:hypothetical protein